MRCYDVFDFLFFKCNFIFDTAYSYISFNTILKLCAALYIKA